jgi:hypothetical protein
MAARELEGLSLSDALDLTLLIREADRRRYEHAAIRWLERFIQERGPTLADVRTFATCFAIARAVALPQAARRGCRTGRL